MEDVGKMETELKPELISDLTKLNKTELISLLRQKIVAESNTRFLIQDLKDQCDKYKTEANELYKEFADFRNKAAKVIKVDAEHHQQQLKIVFSTLENLELLMKGADYSFLNEPTEESPKE